MTQDRPIRAAFYLRVSKNRQAEHDLSIPDQRRQAERYCEAKGWHVGIAAAPIATRDVWQAVCPP